jgi:translation initiation factor IF-3
MKQEFRVNEKIKARTVRLIDENGNQIGIVPIEKARDIAREHGYDLVEVQAHANPPVCKLLDYGRFKYELKKREREARRKQKILEEKEIRFRYKIAEHDIMIKLSHARRFLLENCKVIFTVILRGREIEFKEIGKQILEKAKKELADISKLAYDIKVEGNKLSLGLLPDLKKGSQDAKTQGQKIDT